MTAGVGPDLVGRVVCSALPDTVAGGGGVGRLPRSASARGLFSPLFGRIKQWRREGGEGGHALRAAVWKGVWKGENMKF